MIGKKLTTLQQLKENVGAYVKLKIDGVETLGRIWLSTTGECYILNNIVTAGTGETIPDSEFPHILYAGNTFIRTTCYVPKDIEIIDNPFEDKKVYYEPAEGNYQFDQEGDFKPYAVYVSNESEEDAIESGKVTWYFGAKNFNGHYLTWDERYDDIDSLKRASIDGCCISWRYMVPVEIDLPTKEDKKKQELFDRLEALEQATKSIKEELGNM